MEVYMLVVSETVSPMAKENLIIMSPNLMISNIIMANGKMVYLMEMPMHITIMAIFIKETFTMGRDKVLARMFSIKFIDMKVNGKIIPFQEKENYSEMDNYFLKVSFRMVWNMAMENISMKMVIFSKEITSKMKNVEEADTIFIKVGYYSHNLTQDPPKFLAFNWQMVQFTLDNKKTVLVKVLVRQHMLMVVSTKVNGKMIKNMEQEYFNTLMELNMMGNGKMI